MRLDKISDRIYANCDGATGGNVGIILLKDSTVAVDAQYPGSAKDFRASIPDVTGKPVSHLILTHIHGDHIYGAQAFDDCEIIAHRRLKEKMEESLKTEWTPEKLQQNYENIKKNSPDRAWLFEGLRIVLPTQTFDTSYTLEDVNVINTGGHSDCSSIVYIPQEKTLFAGDLVFAERFPWAGDPTSHPDTWIKAFQKILDMDVETIIPGHGPVCNKDEIRVQIKWFKEARDIMAELISKDSTVEEAVKPEHYPEFYDYSGGRLERSLRHWYSVLSP